MSNRPPATHLLFSNSLLFICILSIGLLAGSAARADSPPDLTQLSLEDLVNLEVTSVSKVPKKRNQAAAAIAVITGEDIRRSTWRFGT